MGPFDDLHCSACDPTAKDTQYIPQTEPVVSQFLVTAIVQLIVEAEDDIDARIKISDELDGFIAQVSDARHDPMNGRVITAADDVTFRG